MESFTTGVSSSGYKQCIFVAALSNFSPATLYLSDLLISPPFVMHPSVFGLQQVCREGGRVCSLSHQKGLVSQWANMFMQSHPFWRDLWAVCWCMQGEMGPGGRAVATLALHLQLLYFFHMLELSVVTDAFSLLTCSFLPSGVQKTMLSLTHWVSLQSQREEETMLMCCCILRKTSALNRVKAVDCSAIARHLLFLHHLSLGGKGLRANL